MIGFQLVAVTLLMTLLFAVSLRTVKAIVARTFTWPEFSALRDISLLVLALGLAALLILRPTAGWVYLTASVLLSVVLFVRASVDVRGGFVQQQLGFVYLYGGTWLATYRYLDWRGMISALGASESFAFELRDFCTRLVRPAAEGVAS